MTVYKAFCTTWIWRCCKLSAVMYEAPVIFEDVMGYRICSVFNHVSEFEEHSPKNVTMNGELLSNYKFIQRTERKERHHRKTPFTLFPSQKDLRRSGVLTLLCFVPLSTKMTVMQKWIELRRKSSQYRWGKVEHGFLLKGLTLTLCSSMSENGFSSSSSVFSMAKKCPVIQCSLSRGYYFLSVYYFKCFKAVKRGHVT